MKVLIVNTYESGGGAAVAALRLAEALQSVGVEVRMLVAESHSSKPFVVSAFRGKWGSILHKACFIAERMQIFTRNGYRRKDLFSLSTASYGKDLSLHPLVEWADVIHLHWINQGFLSLRGLNRLAKTGKPILWTLHDFWPLQSLAHLPGTSVPATLNALAEKVAAAKKTFNEHAAVTYIAVSRWQQSELLQSPLLAGKPILRVPNPIDTTQFHPQEPLSMFPTSRYALLFVAARLDAAVKAPELLCEVMTKFRRKYPELSRQTTLYLIGEVKDAEAFSSLPENHQFLGSIRSVKHLAEIYASSNILLSTSRYETFGQTLTEALACGCSVMSFDNSGPSDIIVQDANGRLIPAYDTEAYADGLAALLPRSSSLEQRLLCRRSVASFEAQEVAKEMVETYLGAIASAKNS